MSLKQISLPQQDEINLARESASELAKFLAGAPVDERAQIKLSDTDIIVPRFAIDLLRDILTDMSQGKAVSIMPLHAEMTTQQAADFLNVSRPHLVKLLEAGDLAFSKVGSHRRVQLQHLIEYKKARQERSMQAMDELAALDEEYGLE